MVVVVACVWGCVLNSHMVMQGHVCCDVFDMSWARGQEARPCRGRPAARLPPVDFVKTKGARGSGWTVTHHPSGGVI